MMIILILLVCRKIGLGIANSADPDQTAPPQEQSDLGLHCMHYMPRYFI